MEDPGPGLRRTGARALIVAASVTVVVAGLKGAAAMILPLLSGLFLAMLSLPLLNWLQARRIPTWLAVTITILTALSLLGGAVLLVGGSLKEFTLEAPKYRAALENLSNDLLIWLDQRGVRLPPETVREFLDPGQLVDLVAGTLRRAATLLPKLLLVLLTVVFLLLEAAGFPDKLVAAFGRRETSLRFLGIRRDVQRYLAIKTLISLVTGAVVAAGLAAIGVDFPLLWGVIAFLLNYIPVLGAILSAVPPLLLALADLGVGQAIAVAALYLGIHIVLGNFTEPLLMGRRLGLSTFVVFVSLVFWGWVWGPVGMLLSVPLTMIVKIMLEHTEDLRWVAVLLGSTPAEGNQAQSALPTPRPDAGEPPPRASEVGPA